MRNEPPTVLEDPTTGGESGSNNNNAGEKRETRRRLLLQIYVCTECNRISAVSCVNRGDHGGRRAKESRNDESGGGENRFCGGTTIEIEDLLAEVGWPRR